MSSLLCILMSMSVTHLPSGSDTSSYLRALYTSQQGQSVHIILSSQYMHVSQLKTIRNKRCNIYF
jgi:hypothetical protein